MAVKRVQEKRFSREITDFETLDVDGIVRTNVGYKFLSDTAESRHFCLNNTQHVIYRMYLSDRPTLFSIRGVIVA